MTSKDETLNAQVVLFAPGGKNILKEKEVTTGNIQQVSPAAETVNAAAAQLHKMGFNCNPSYPTLSISGPRSLFEEMFKLSFTTKQQKDTRWIVPAKKATIPAPLKNIVADVIFGEPTEYFI